MANVNHQGYETLMKKMKKNNQNEKVRTLIVIGGGFAARNFLFHLLYHPQFEASPCSWNITVIESPKMAPSCSEFSTSLCALRGSKIETPRGEKLVQGFYAAQDFYNLYHPQGIEKGRLTSLCLPHHFHEEDYRRRFGELVESTHHLPYFPDKLLNQEVLAVSEDAYFFDAPVYFKWMDQKIEERLQNIKVRWEKKEAFINDMEFHSTGITLKDEYQTHYQAQEVVLCTGAYTKIFEKLFPPLRQIEESKVQAGYYLEFENQDLGDKGWGVNLFEKKILIYRPHSRKLLLTGGHAEGPMFAPPLQQLHDSYQEFVRILGATHILPPFKDAKIQVGLRQKGLKRQPFWGEIKRVSPEVCLYGLFSLYKNGLSYSFLGAKKLADDLV